jgi:MazG family protein
MSSTPDAAPEAAPGADHAETAPGSLDRALALVRFLRANCPWDAAQTAETLIPHLVEEAREVVDAIHHDDPRELEGELGDLLLNLAFQVVVAEEKGELTADSVTRRLEAKMRRRHPHLYGDGPKEEWETIKAREREEGRRARKAEGVDGEEAAGAGEDRGEPGVLDGMASSLDPLTTAHRMQERVARVGFDWESHRGAFDKVAEELDEVREALENGAAAGPGHPEGAGPAGRRPPPSPEVEEELGDLLFAAVNLVRLAGSHPVRALDAANRKFRRRFTALEALARERGVALGEASLQELDRLWDELKVRERLDV